MEKQAASQAGQTAEAREAFLAWKAKYEMDATRKRSRLRHLLFWPVGAVVACAVAALILVPRTTNHKPALPTAAEVLQGVRGFQNELRQKTGTLHQVVRVDVVQSRPTARRSSARVEIWSDRAGGRYASRWLDEGKSLKYAVWRWPGRAPYVYAAAGSTLRVAHLFQPVPDDLTVESLERAFFDWLSSKDWQVAADFSEAVTRDGTRLQVERLASGDLLLKAFRAGTSLRVEFRMEVEAGTYRPRLQVMRLETAERALELRVACDGLEVLLQPRVDAAVFEPDRLTATVPPAPPSVAGEAPSAAAPEENIEVEILYAVHRVHACVEGNVQISPAAGGVIEVRAIVGSEARRAQLAETLQQVGAGRLRADIQVVGSGRGGPERVHPLLPAEGVETINRLYLEALALVRLAERFGPGQGTHLALGQRKLVESMVREHVAALREGSQAALGQVESLLASLGGVPEGVAGLPAPTDWAAAVSGIFHTLDQADNLIDVPPEVERKQAAARLLSALATLQQRISQLDGLLNAAQP